MTTNINPRPYSLMARPNGRPSAILAHESFLSRAALEGEGWAFVADFDAYHIAAKRESEFMQLPPVEQWWASSFAARAVDA